MNISFSQDVFDIGIRSIEIFFSEPYWDDTLDLYYANDTGERLIADSVIIYNGGDKEYSRVCSFTDVCNYMKDDKAIRYKIDEDTFQVQYSKGILEIYKKRIHNLYLVTYYWKAMA